MNAAASMCASPLAAAGAAGQHDEQRPQALAAPGDDVLGDLVDQRNGALEARPDDASSTAIEIRREPSARISSSVIGAGNRSRPGAHLHVLSQRGLRAAAARAERRRSLARCAVSAGLRSGKCAFDRRGTGQ